MFAIPQVPGLYCYKVIQRFTVTCFIAGQCNTGLLWHITDILVDMDGVVLNDVLQG